MLVADEAVVLVADEATRDMAQPKVRLVPLQIQSAIHASLDRDVARVPFALYPEHMAISIN